MYYKEGANGKMTSYAQYSPYWCLNCITSYENKDTFELHKNFCVNSSGQLEEYPIFGVNDVLKFSHHDNQYKQEITGKVSLFCYSEVRCIYQVHNFFCAVFFDFEALTFDKTELERDDELEAIDDVSFTKIICEHKPIIWSMIVSTFC